MDKVTKVALIGKSGAGKSEVANHLVSKYSFTLCNTGKRCREIAREFFNSESKDILQQITDSFNNIEKGVWLKVALQDKVFTNSGIVIDSIRFIEDYNFAKKNGFKIWKVETPQAIRISRLSQRGQEYKFKNDHHQSETELENIVPDFIIFNSRNSIENLHSVIDNKINDDR